MCDPILVTVLKMQPHYSQSSRENATPSSGTSPVASYKEVPPPGLNVAKLTTSLVLIGVHSVFFVPEFLQAKRRQWIKSWKLAASSGQFSGPENVSVSCGFTGRINHRFLTNQSARSISVIL